MREQVRKFSRHFDTARLCRGKRELRRGKEFLGLTQMRRSPNLGAEVKAHSGVPVSRAAPQMPTGVAPFALSLVLCILPLAKADVTEVPPFTGTQSETWEEFPVMKFGGSEIPTFGGTAIISGTLLETDTSQMFLLCYFYAYPTDGKMLMGADSTGANITISFSQSVSAFGAYWGNFPGPPGRYEGCRGTGLTFTFMDTAGNLLGSVSYPAGFGSEPWRGFAFSTPVKTIQVSGDYPVTDGMQATIAPANSSVSLANISTRLRVDTGENALIGGFIVSGTQPKKVIVRAIGPSLAMAGALANPTLELRDSSGGLIRSNDNWRTDQETEITATGIAPKNDLESAIVATLPANNAGYTAIVRGANNTTGIGLVEAYDLDRTVDSKLANISTRGLVQTGDNTLIAGTIVLGPTSQKVLVRAIGPSLSVAGRLADPTLELRDQNGGLLRFNDNWRSDQEAEINATTIPPPNDLESAIVQTLPANGASYTAIVRGANNTTGIAVAEVYALN